MRKTKGQRLAMNAQGYVANPQQEVCGRCRWLGSKTIPNEAPYPPYEQAWCSVGDFPTKRTATCGLWEGKK